MLVLSVRNSVIWELAGSLVDIYFAQPLPLQAATPYGNDEKLTQNFVAGLSSENEYFSVRPSVDDPEPFPHTRFLAPCFRSLSPANRDLDSSTQDRIRRYETPA